MVKIKSEKYVRLLSTTIAWEDMYNNGVEERKLISVYVEVSRDFLAFLFSMKLTHRPLIIRRKPFC